MEIIFMFYLCFSLFASAIYFNIKTSETTQSRYLNFLLIWIIPIVWAIVLRNRLARLEYTNQYSLGSHSPGNYKERDSNYETSELLYSDFEEFESEE